MVAEASAATASGAGPLDGVTDRAGVSASMVTEEVAMVALPAESVTVTLTVYWPGTV